MDQFKPGQTVRCTIVSTPRRQDAADTIARLMRQDAAIRRGLRAGQTRRRQTMAYKGRGGRQWAQRKKCAKVAMVEAGQSWTMAWAPQLSADFASVAPYVSIGSA